MVGCGGQTATVAAVPFIADEDRIGGMQKKQSSGAGVRWISHVVALLEVVGRHWSGWSVGRLFSVLVFVTWSPVHLNVGISMTVTLFKF